MIVPAESEAMQLHSASLLILSFILAARVSPPASSIGRAPTPAAPGTSL